MTDNPKSPIENARSTQRIALVIQYLGTDFHGWQRQPNQRTVQEEIETTISNVLERPVTLYAAGRTDAGVHAAAQVAHFDADGPIPAHRWASVLNSRLAKDILIRASAKVEPTWHARFSASWRRYRYTLYTDPIPNLFVRPYAWHCYHAPVDESLIQAALTPLIGRHHLAAFHRAGSARPHSWVDVQAAECHRSGPLIYIEVQASGFLYGMMRLLVGLLVQVGRGERAIDNFTDIWVNERREMVKYAAPAQGLCLLRVGYQDFPFPTDVWYDTQPKLVIGY
ncbi:MAG: tRNA pseudouridine(38-40) synthase TruA [Microcoleus sp. PH2017_29_MFU_D_A]|jgi:tRNA pseudouridine38-40 synthase|uniref:tRNA pseudouridine(38-40) synthase TruA n=1 Tax=unclassified Microcoleus TaxID=2642155 RepID=UPI001D521E67|nr:MULTISPECIES: tRNA pseudouridine(38-40) synthase TruA [unclassified Microcoleus]MCC3417549.1 tRNA pseudouridine(38-40) synthase TruA [Microcoleus sp. PH2017_07_MST_O_A]MCC3428805.1 tRNA pseudouridine(38-40) synthase TruA [Microcoleus sp. PH2017_04_SCI_O_A]MCC3440257.1 tRNA pseudouridine(38-40) synthase TruA [Microcoleus sp. PH2017_03_ELD_O_A]MCC3465396.1 tRNA pseudouridine(38-40) synthase TruA [Microcoleus sp. PH2017_06_SFM_O_A]MCC3501525.1 tRNA pseudouridine(38-40) synthase TruA [Microcole